MSRINALVQSSARECRESVRGLRSPLSNVVATMALCLVVAGVSVAVSPVFAQTETELPAPNTFAPDSDEPVDIEADRLEVFDDRKVAIFSGNVIVRQGDLEMRAPRLEVDYLGGGGPGAGASVAPGAGQISRISAVGGVEIISADQTARGDRAVYEVDSQTIRLSGNVVLAEGENVLRGTELIVDLATNSSRLVSDASGTGGRVRGLFVPGQGNPLEE